MKRVIIVKPRSPRPLFSERLEARAMRAVRQAARQEATSPVLLTIASELALTLEQLRAARRTHARVHEELRLLESYIERDLRRWMPPQLDYLAEYRYVRDRLRQRQLKLGAERRRLAFSEVESVRPLQDRLLTLLSRQRYLGVLHDDREAGA